MIAERGLFITFEGGEGSGKTTQLRLLADKLVKNNREVVCTREPGGVEGAESIRRLVVEGKAPWHAVSETLLFLAARKEHYEKLIKPALERGAIVLCDRFADSTLVYQGIAKGLGVEYIQQLSRLALGNIQPDCTLLFDISPEKGLERAHARHSQETRFEALGIKFHILVREGFLLLAKHESIRIHCINAEASIEEIAKDVLLTLRKIIKL